MKDFLKRISSRKFIFFAIATIAMFTETIQPSHWLIASGIFIGGKTLEILMAGIKKSPDE